MYRYLAFLWCNEDQAAATRVKAVSRRLQANGSEWTLALDGVGLTILHANPQPGCSRAYVLPNGAGAVLGRLFSTSLTRGVAPTDTDLNGSVSGEILRSRGRYLIQHYWGRYVGFFRDEARGEHYVLRDPSGGVPCFYRDWGTVRVFFADVGDIVDLCLGPLEVNWTYVTAFLRDNHLQIADTGLLHVSQLLAGEQVVVGAKGVSRGFLWNPIRIAENEEIENFNHACERFESVAKTCIGAWGSIYNMVVHQLSGGLDSSIVLSCLVQAPKRPHILCVNQYFAGAPESDERKFARSAAARFRCDLIEMELQSEASGLRHLLSSRVTPSPSLAVFSHQQNHVSNLAAKYPVDAFLSGRGGDQLLYRFRQSIIAADYARKFGVSPELFRIVLDTARLTRRSFWSVLRTAIEHGMLRRFFDVQDLFLPQVSLLSEHALRSVDRRYHMHPWLIEAARLPPGKMAHVYSVVDLQFFQEPSSFDQVADAPLMFASQPLVELCLRVPTYVLTKGGVDRAVERTAFKRDLPREITERHSKGTTTRYFRDVVTANLPLLRGLLLDGMLVRQGLIDRARLEQTLAKDETLRPEELGSVLDCVAGEVWLHAWQGIRRQAAA